jgi:hypothetical protein
VEGRQRTIRQAFESAALVAAVAVVLSACSEVGFPAVHDVPAPRAEITLSPDQVKQATDDLICERDHLTNGAQSGVQAGGAATTSAKPPAAPQKPCTPPPAVTGSVVPASAYAKP